MYRKSLCMVFGVLLFMLALTPGVSGNDSATRMAYLTFSQPVRLPGVGLGSGTYIFEQIDRSGPVRVMSLDRRTAYYLGFTTQVNRPPQLSPDVVVSLGESAPGSTPPITAWWPRGESTGHAFIYR